MEDFRINDLISIDYFSKPDIRIGTIIEVSDHTNADKLYVLKVEFNSIPDRQIVAGIKKYYSKDELMGKQISIVVNLGPAVLRGVESQGMLLAAGDDKNVVLLSPEKEIRNFAKVK